MSATPAPEEVFLRRAVDLRRFENHEYAVAVDILRRIRREIEARIAGLPESITKRRLEALLQQVNATLRTGYRNVSASVRTDLVRYARTANEITNRDGQAAVPGIDLHTVELTPARLRAIVDGTIIQGEVLADWWTTLAPQTGAAVARQLRMGLAQHETPQQMIRRVQQVWRKEDHQVEAVVRTAINTVQGEVAHRTMSGWGEGFEKYRWDATLDPRTCLPCAELDGTEWRWDDPQAPRHPLHWNCRCRYVPIVDYDALDIPRPDWGDATRAAAGGPVAHGTTYEGWFKAQSATLQNDILGPARAELYRTGKMGLRDLVTGDHRQLTIEQLRARSGLE